jgi:hypothetical protein
MPSAVQELKERLERLEEEVAELKSQFGSKKGEPWWRRTVGMFKGDKAFAEIVRLGRQIREAERENYR